MYKLALDPRAMVANYFDLGLRVWDPGLRRAPNNWKVGELVDMLSLLDNTSSVQGIRDEWVRVLNKRGCFTT